MKKINLLNFILFGAIAILDIFYIIFGGLWLKAITSITFVLTGAINLIYAIKINTKQKRFSIILLVGLTFAMLGDIVLNIYFIGGAALFAVGHVFYFISYCQIRQFKAKDLIYGTIIFIPSCLLITLAPMFEFNGILMEVVCVVYALIISLMVGKAVSNFVGEKTLLNIIVLIGSCLFFFSDLMLLINVFSSAGQVFDVLCLATYYPAEFLLAYSIYVGSKQK